MERKKRKEISGKEEGERNKGEERRGKKEEKY